MSQLLNFTLLWTYFINDHSGEEFIGTFYEKELQKTNQIEFRIERVIKRIDDNYMSNGKVIDKNSWIDKKDLA